jgi:hypothetical protein
MSFDQKSRHTSESIQSQIKHFYVAIKAQKWHQKREELVKWEMSKSKLKKISNSKQN